MRLAPLILGWLVASAPLFAQDWQTTTVTEDGFRANFPGEPTVESIAYETEFRLSLPGHVYRAADALGKYSTTVVDYRDVQRLHDERSAKCLAAKGAKFCSTPDAHEPKTETDARQILARTQIVLSLADAGERPAFCRRGAVCRISRRTTSIYSILYRNIRARIRSVTRLLCGGVDSARAPVAGMAVTAPLFCSRQPHDHDCVVLCGGKFPG